MIFPAVLRTIGTIALLVTIALPKSMHAQDPTSVRGWTETQAGNWLFDDANNAWQYSDHTWNRQLFFTLELMTAPDRANDKTVAWAYPIDAIKSEKMNQMVSDFRNYKLGVAVQVWICEPCSEQRQYFVMSDHFLRNLTASASTTTREPLDLFEEDNALYFVSLERMPDILRDNSRVRRISSWREEASRALQDVSWGFWDSCPAGPRDTWRGLIVAPECRCSTYDRHDYRYPRSVETQIAERHGMVSPYDGTSFRSLQESDIDHVVALLEAHDSGLCAASLAVRTRFASDLDNLVLATPRVNRLKAADDAAEWQPEGDRCWFARTVIAVRHRYQLTIDEPEVAALDVVLDGCN